ncbi:MAG: hypothetical protein EON93_02245 [Burkholderiales bacterium]|nr:MAG: hypothetical protein EON93_02245 [Burkholderiales bacterium]
MKVLGVKDAYAQQFVNAVTPYDVQAITRAREASAGLPESEPRIVAWSSSSGGEKSGVMSFIADRSKDWTRFETPARDRTTAVTFFASDLLKGWPGNKDNPERLRAAKAALDAMVRDTATNKFYIAYPISDPKYSAEKKRHRVRARYRK